MKLLFSFSIIIKGIDTATSAAAELASVAKVVSAAWAILPGATV